MRNPKTGRNRVLPAVLASWFRENSDWFRDNKISWDEAVYHAFLTQKELMDTIDMLKDEVEKGYLIILYEKKDKK